MRPNVNIIVAMVHYHPNHTSRPLRVHHKNTLLSYNYFHSLNHRCTQGVQGNSKLRHSKLYKHFGFMKTSAAQRAHVYAFKNIFKGLHNSNIMPTVMSAIPFIM